MIFSKTSHLLAKNAVLSLFKKRRNSQTRTQFVDEYKYNYVVARVVGRSFDFDKNYFLIDKGARHGLSVGLPVTMDQGLVVGRLIRVEENIAEVRLLTDSESQIAVTIIGEEGSAGLAKGEHNINLRIEMLPKEAKIAIGDLVVTSNLNLNTPPGLVLGRVQKIEFSDNNLWQSAVAEPLVDYSNLSLVTIILPANSQ